MSSAVWNGLLEQMYAVQALQEPTVDARALVYVVYGVTLLESLGYGVHSFVGRVLQLLVDIHLHGLVAHEAVLALSHHAQALLYRLLESAAHGHYLAHAFHRRSEQLRHAVELVQIPARDLAHHIIQRRFEAGRSDLRYRVLYLVQSVTQS